MKCHQFKNNVEALLAGEMDKRAAEAMQEHASQCCDCDALMKSTEALTQTVTEIGVLHMPASLESRIQNSIYAEAPKRPRLLSSFLTRRWAFAGVALAVLATTGLMLYRQPQVTAAAIVAEAEAKLDGVSSYHLRYKGTIVNADSKKTTTDFEIWYRQPRDLRLDTTQHGKSDTQILSGDSTWNYRRGSGTAMQSPPPDNEEWRKRALSAILPRSPKGMLQRLGEAFRYVGRRNVGHWDCEVVESKVATAYIDRDTGVIVRMVNNIGHGTVVTDEAIFAEVNHPLPNSVFQPSLPEGTVIYKAPVNAMDFTFVDKQGNVPKAPWGEESLSRIARQGAQYGARLKHLFAAQTIPVGFKFLGVGTYGEKWTDPEGHRGVAFGKGFSTLYVNYVNPRTGGTLIITESADRAHVSDGCEVSWDGARAVIVKHSDPFPYVELFWKQGDTNLAVYASLITEEEAIKVAKSMRPFVPKPLPAGSEPFAMPESEAPTTSTVVRIEAGTKAADVDRAVVTLRQRLESSGLKHVTITELAAHRLKVESQDDAKWDEKIDKAEKGLPFFAEGTTSTDLEIIKGTSVGDLNHAISVLRKRLQAAGLEDIKITKLPKDLLHVETQNIPDGAGWIEKVSSACSGLPVSSGHKTELFHWPP